MDKYVLIIETNSEQALVMEQYIECADYDSVYERYKRAQNQSNVTKVCIAKLEYETGNRNAIK